MSDRAKWENLGRWMVGEEPVPWYVSDPHRAKLTHEAILASLPAPRTATTPAGPTTAEAVDRLIARLREIWDATGN